MQTQITFVDGLGTLATALHRWDDCDRCKTFEALAQKHVPGITANASVRYGWPANDTFFFFKGTDIRASLRRMVGLKSVVILVVLKGSGDGIKEARQSVERCALQPRERIKCGSLLRVPMAGDKTTVVAQQVPEPLADVHALLCGAVAALGGKTLTDACMAGDQPKAEDFVKQWLIDFFRQNYIDLVFQAMDNDCLLLPPACVIPDRAFQMCSWKSIKNDNKIIKIGKNGFSNARFLKSVKLSSVQHIMASAFWYCPRLTTVDLKGAPLKAIKHSAFYACSSLSSVVLNDTLVSIGSYAFTDTKLKHIDIPESVKHIGNNAFRSTPLQQITIRVSTVSTGCFRDCTKLKIVRLIGVNTIGKHAFSHSGVRAVLGLENVREIGNHAFAYSRLRRVVVRGVVATDAFLECTALRSADVNGSTLHKRAFCDCTALMCVPGATVKPPLYLGDYHGSGNWLWDQSPFWGCFNTIRWRNKVVHVTEEARSDGTIEKLCARAMGVPPDHLVIALICNFLPKPIRWLRPPTIDDLVHEELKVRKENAKRGCTGKIINVALGVNALVVTIKGCRATPAVLGERWSKRLLTRVIVREEALKHANDVMVFCVSGKRRSLVLLKHRLGRSIRRGI